MKNVPKMPLKKDFLSLPYRIRPGKGSIFPFFCAPIFYLEEAHKKAPAKLRRLLFRTESFTAVSQV